MQENPFAGIGLHAVGAFSSASCYTPQKQTKLWSWEIYWISQASCAWLILPIAFAFLTIPNYAAVVSQCPEAALRSFLFGLVYGIGGLSFGLGIRYIGFSLNYAIAIGISACAGTILPLIYHPNKGFVWEIVDKFSSLPGWIILAGILISLIGIAFCGWAGVLRERFAGSGPSQYSFKIGVPLAILAGIFSAVFNYALLAGDPLANAAFKAGSSDLLKMNAIYPFSHGGAWVASGAWCIFLIFRNKSGTQFIRLPDAGPGRLPFYYLMALLSGAFWYFQFFFYGMGQAFLGTHNEYTSWALHMAMLILFSNVYGVLFREWSGAGKRSRWTLQAGMVIIVVATLVIAYGMHLGKQLPTAQ
jgi:L-rhamnose-H+ transport protein